jgi:hypothetical protein
MTKTDTTTRTARTRTASCACGGLKLTLAGEPTSVYACACQECQRATGSAFAYRAKYPKTAIMDVTGERRSWRRGSDAGRWIEQTFCPTCGTLLFMEGEVIPNDIVVSVGCFIDSDFAPPAALFWSGRRHGWYQLADGIATP